MASPIPLTMHALVVQKDRTLAIEERPIPSLVDNEILVKVIAVAQNQTDWETLKFDPNAPGKILGCDFSGVVVKVANNLRGNVSVGDHVAGFEHGGQYEDRGAFATHLKAESDLVWVVPPDTVSFEEAAAMGCGLWSAVQSLFHPGRLELTELPGRTTSAEWIFIDGFNTSVGMYATQLAHLSGYKIVTAAPSENHPLPKSLGADAVHNYNSPNIFQDIRKSTGNNIAFALDTIGDETSQSASVELMRPSGGTVVTLLAPDEEAARSRENVKDKQTMVCTALGRPFVKEGVRVPASPEDRSHMVKSLTNFPRWAKEGSVKPNSVKVWGGGLASIKDGLEKTKGRVFAEKIVYRI